MRVGFTIWAVLIRRLSSWPESILHGLGRDLGQVREPEEIDGALESVRISAGEEVEVRISGDGNSFQNNHGTREKCKVVGDTKREGEEDLVELEADGHEPLVTVWQNLKFGWAIFFDARRVVVQLLHDFQQSNLVDI